MQSSPCYRRDDTEAFKSSRDERYFNYDGRWYFATREGVIMGPYDSRAQAIAETNTYIAFIKAAKSPVLSVIRSRKATVSSGQA